MNKLKKRKLTPEQRLDLMIYGNAFTFNDVRVDPKHVHSKLAKVAGYDWCICGAIKNSNPIEKC